MTRAVLAAQQRCRPSHSDSAGRDGRDGPADRHDRQRQLPAAETARPQQLASPQREEGLRLALATASANRSVVRYRGFVLLPQPDLGWLVRPERSPMAVLPFRTPPISLCDVKALVDWRLDGAPLTLQPRRGGDRRPGGENERGKLVGQHCH